MANLESLSDRVLNGQISAQERKLSDAGMSKEDRAKCEAYLAALKAELTRRSGAK